MAASIRVDALASLLVLGLVPKDRVLVEARRLAVAGRIRYRPLRRVLRIIAALESEKAGKTASNPVHKLDNPKPPVREELRELRIRAQSGQGSLDEICERVKEISRDKDAAVMDREIAKRLLEELRG